MEAEEGLSPVGTGILSPVIVRVDTGESREAEGTESIGRGAEDCGLTVTAKRTDLGESLFVPMCEGVETFCNEG